jgi:hypothetical protein
MAGACTPSKEKAIKGQLTDEDNLKNRRYNPCSIVSDCRGPCLLGIILVGAAVTASGRANDMASVSSR